MFFPIITPAPIVIVFRVIREVPKPKGAQFDQAANLKFSMTEIRSDGKGGAVELAKLKTDKPLVLFFFSEQCGVTFAYKKRLQQIVKDFESRGVSFVGIRAGRKEKPNEPVDIAEPKYLKMPFLDDAIGDATSYFEIGQSLTFVVLDKEGKMRFRGGFDDNINEKRVTKTYLRTALRELTTGKPISAREGKVIGCAILPIKTDAQVKDK